MKSIIPILPFLLLLLSCGRVKKAVNVLTSDEETKTADTVYVVESHEDTFEESSQNTHELPKNSNESAIHRLRVSNARYDWSLAAQYGNSYQAANLVDGSPLTAWAVNLSSAPFDCDALVGPEFTIDAREIDHIIFTNGYAKSKKSFNDNSRAGTIIIARYGYDHESDSPAESSKVLFAGHVADNPQPQRLPISPHYRHIPGAQRYQIIFVDFVDGAKYDDLCISEIAFYGH